VEPSNAELVRFAKLFDFCVLQVDVLTRYVPVPHVFVTELDGLTMPKSCNMTLAGPILTCAHLSVLRCCHIRSFPNRLEATLHDANGSDRASDVDMSRCLPTICEILKQTFVAGLNQGREARTAVTTSGIVKLLSISLFRDSTQLLKLRECITLYHWEQFSAKQLRRRKVESVGPRLVDRLILATKKANWGNGSRHPLKAGWGKFHSLSLSKPAGSQTPLASRSKDC